jgi:hypothetical protein
VPACLRIVAATITESIARSIPITSVAAIRCTIAAAGLGQEAVAIASIAHRRPIVVPSTASTANHHDTVTPSITTIAINGVATFIPAIFSTTSVSSIPHQGPGRPLSSCVSSSWPVPCPSGSAPVVLVAEVADGVVVNFGRSNPPTGGGVDGTTQGGILDERLAAAVIRTTSEDLTSPSPHNVDGSAGGSRTTILLLTAAISSLLPHSNMTQTANSSSSSSIGGRRGSSGQPLGTALTSTGSLTPPTTAGLRRAALRHHCRSAAGALAPSPVTPLRVATASLLTSSRPPQLGRPHVTGRAGERRTARRTQPPLEAAMVG